MIVRRTLFVVSACLGLWLLAGCGAGERTAFVGPETEDAYYREGLQLERSGRHAEALNAYLNAIESRGTAHSPESHLQIAIIYKDHIKDPYEAVHYFKKYTELAPPSPQVALARDQMDAAKRDILQTMPGRLFEDQSVRLNTTEELARLQRENDELRAQLQTQRGGFAPLPAGRTQPGALGNVLPSPTPFPAGANGTANNAGGLGASLTTNGAASPFSANPRTTGGINIPGVGGTAPAPRGAQPAAPAGSRRYKIKLGDTLSSIARQHYGNNSAASLNAIARANSGVMSNINVLPRVGTELVIPPAP